jgi:hypothetical protein
LYLELGEGHGYLELVLGRQRHLDVGLETPQHEELHQVVGLSQMVHVVAHKQWETGTSLGILGPAQLRSGGAVIVRCAAK